MSKFLNSKLFRYLSVFLFLNPSISPVKSSSALAAWELKTPRTIKGNGPIKEIRLGKPNKGKTRLVIEFKEDTYLKPLTCQMVGLDQNRWRIKLFKTKYSFKKIGEGLVEKRQKNRLT